MVNFHFNFHMPSIYKEFLTWPYLGSCSIAASVVDIEVFAVETVVFDAVIAAFAVETEDFVAEVAA